MSKGKAIEEIRKLVQKYERIAEEGRIKDFNEAQTRNGFIEPLFQSLGWDMRNLDHDNEVTTEETVSSGRVDLAFRLGNIPVMFLEAKSMKVDLDQWKWAEQAINYSWNKGVSWAVLTDFESIKVFNAETPPKSLQHNLFFEISCKDFESGFEQLWLLSKEAFEQRALEKQAEKWGKRTARKHVGEKLFHDLLDWRAALTKEFKRKNLSLTDEELDEGVQRVLDRLIFIRTAEDRKLEPDILLTLQRQREHSIKGTLYADLVKLFRKLDDEYDSKLFAKHYSEEWQASDEVFGEIVKGLYETEDGYRYDFSAISSDILGGIYEQYLGMVLAKSTKKSEAKLEDRKRKNQGIYYTPKYVVEFIVKETLGEILKKTKSKDVSKIKVLDPACGSGSFLTAAFDAISEHAEKTLFSKVDILKNNIFGVDLDGQAVEIAQLNLLLKVLVQKIKLPKLQNNLRVGNSLISKGEEKFKPFDYAEEFEQAFNQGGFDVIIGNPPYIKEYTNKSAFDGLHESPYYQGKMDIWTLFGCKAIDLLKVGGYLGFIAPNNWLTNAGASIFRDKVMTEGEIIQFVDFGDYKVFQDAGIQTMVLIFKKGKVRRSYTVDYAKIIDKLLSENSVVTLLQTHFASVQNQAVSFKAEIIPSTHIGKNITFINKTDEKILEKIQNAKNFELLDQEVAQGIVGAPDKCFLVHDVTRFGPAEREFIKPFFTSTDRYGSVPRNPDEYILYLSDKNFRGKKIADYPNIESHFEPFKNVLKEAKIQYKTPDKPYYYLHRERAERFFIEGPKVVGQTRTLTPSFLFTTKEYFGSRAMNFIKTNRINPRYLTALLNSNVSCFWLKKKGKQLGDLLQIDKGPLLAVPLAKPEVSKEMIIATFVDKVIDLNQQLHTTNLDTDKWNELKRQVDKVEGEINREIYALYGLNQADIERIENVCMVSSE